MMLTCDHTFETADALLKRNWFLHMQDVIGFINELPEHVYWQVVDNRDAYPSDISWMLYETTHPGRMRVRNYDFVQEDARVEATRQERLKAHHASFVPPPRPRAQLDIEYETCKVQLQKKRETVEELKSLYVRTRKYVPPSQRKHLTYNDDPVIRDSMHALAAMENEFMRKTERLEALQKQWNELAWIDAVLADAAKRPSFLSNAPVNIPSAYFTAPLKSMHADTISKPLPNNNLRNIIQKS
jgi:hypothetical protein